MLKKLFRNNLFVWSFIGIALLLVCVVASTYAFFNYSRVGGDNVINTGVITFNYTDNVLIDISNDFPQDDYSDMSTAEFNALKSSHGGSLNITAHSNISGGINYSIYVIRGDAISGKTRLLDENILFLFTPNFSNGNGFTSLTNNYSSPTALTFDGNGRALIATGRVQNTSSSTTVGYNFSMWVDGSSTFISSTTKRATLAEGNPSLAVSTTGNVTAGRYMKNDSTLTTVTLYPARTAAQGKIIYTTKEFSTGFYNIKFVVEATEATS